MSCNPKAAPRRVRGFSLIELMVVLASVAVLSAIAISSYLSYLTRSKVRTAQSDLVALSLNLENALQRQLAYPMMNTTTTAATEAGIKSWHPAQGKDFTYTVKSSATGYLLTAAGISGNLAQCRLTLDDAGQRMMPGNCGSISSW